MLNHDQLQIAVAAARQHFSRLKKKYPELKGYLVLSLPDGQASIDSSALQILCEFPAMVVDDAARTSALKTLSCLSNPAAHPETYRVLKKQLDQFASQLKYHEDCRIEIRFHDLNHDLIWKLQADDLIDRNLTPRTKASIRIVLGTLAHFESTK